MPQSPPLPAIHCINPHCPTPSSQKWGNKFCLSCGTSLQIKNRYVPLKQLGSGGFAITYTVFDLKGKTERVLKILLETSPQALRLFEQEAAVLASLRHPGIPKVETDSFFYITIEHPRRLQLPCLVMEKINGETLEDILERYPTGCPELLVINWLYQSIDILQALHRRNIIHRDIKPANLMLRRETQQVVAIDFGGVKQIASQYLKKGQTNISTRLVSPGYSPPEQIAGGVVGPAADFYALGRTAIHLLTAYYPADLDDPMTGECRWRNRAKVSPALADLLDEMIAPIVSQRPASAADLQARLTNITRRRKRFNKIKRLLQQCGDFLRQIVAFFWQPFWFFKSPLKKLGQGLVNFFDQSISYIAQAVLDTFLAILMGSLGAGIGAGVGFWFVYAVPMGERLSQWISKQLITMMPNLSVSLNPAIFMFVSAGLGTALGLTEAGSFGQNRKFWRAGFFGIIGYILGWFLLQNIAPNTPVNLPINGGKALDAMMAFTALAIVSVTLGLGLPKYHLLQASLAAIGATTIIASFVSLSDIPFNFNIFWLSPSLNYSWQELSTCVVFFAIVAGGGAFCLGMVYHLLIPFLRALGLR